MERDGDPAANLEHSSDAHEETPAVHDLEGDQRIIAVLEKKLADERQRRREAEERASKDDLLKSMYRKRAIIERIEGRIERREAFVVYFLDINNFKRYNDTYGHVQGDELLRTIETLLNERFRRETDHIVIGRYGGDEILLVVTDIVTGDRRSDDIYEQAENMKARLQGVVPVLHEVNPRAKKVDVGFAIGSALFDPDSPMDAVELITLADEEMYKDKTRQKWEAKSNLARFALSALGRKPAF